MEEKPNYYAVIPAEVRYDNELRANEKLLYGEITALTYKTGECWASNTYFSELYGVKPNAVATWIKHLKDKKYIEVDYIYKGKEIQKRILKIGIIQKDTTYSQKDMRGIHKKIGGYSQKGEDNNTSINNTSINNKKKVYKEKYGTYGRVKLTIDEYLRLVNDYGEDLVKRKIDLLDEYVESNNNKNKYTNFNLVLRKAIRENWFENNKKGKSSFLETMKEIYDEQGNNN